VSREGRMDTCDGIDYDRTRDGIVCVKLLHLYQHFYSLSCTWLVMYAMDGKDRTLFCDVFLSISISISKRDSFRNAFVLQSPPFRHVPRDRSLMYSYPVSMPLRNNLLRKVPSSLLLPFFLLFLLFLCFSLRVARGGQGSSLEVYSVAT